MKFTSKDLIETFLKYADSQENNSLKMAVKNIFYANDVLRDVDLGYDLSGEDEDIIFDSETDQAYKALESLTDEHSDGLFSLINVARERMTSERDNKKRKFIDKWNQKTHGRDEEEYFELGIAEINDSLKTNLLDLRSSWGLAHKYAAWLALDRISYYTNIPVKTILTKDNLERIKQTLNKKLSENNPNLDKVLSFTIVE